MFYNSIIISTNLPGSTAHLPVISKITRILYEDQTFTAFQTSSVTGDFNERIHILINRTGWKLGKYFGEILTIFHKKKKSNFDILDELYLWTVQPCSSHVPSKFLVTCYCSLVCSAPPLGTTNSSSTSSLLPYNSRSLYRFSLLYDAKESFSFSERSFSSLIFLFTTWWFRGPTDFLKMNDWDGSS